jgi:hypothetical protein
LLLADDHNSACDDALRAWHDDCTRLEREHKAAARIRSFFSAIIHKTACAQVERDHKAKCDAARTAHEAKLDEWRIECAQHTLGHNTRCATLDFMYKAELHEWQRECERIQREHKDAHDINLQWRLECSRIDRLYKVASDKMARWSSQCDSARSAQVEEMRQGNNPWSDELGRELAMMRQRQQRGP